MDAGIFAKMHCYGERPHAFMAEGVLRRPNTGLFHYVTFPATLEAHHAR
jgi:hypothetical protein